MVSASAIIAWMVCAGPERSVCVSERVAQCEDAAAMVWVKEGFEIKDVGYRAW
jgi:hypothetical protein